MKKSMIPREMLMRIKKHVRDSVDLQQAGGIPRDTGLPYVAVFSSDGEPLVDDEVISVLEQMKQEYIALLDQDVVKKMTLNELHDLFISQLQVADNSQASGMGKLVVFIPGTTISYTFDPSDLEHEQ